LFSNGSLEYAKVDYDKWDGNAPIHPADYADASAPHCAEAYADGLVSFRPL